MRTAIYHSCIFDTCVFAGIRDVWTAQVFSAWNCTFYNCGTGIVLQTTNDGRYVYRVLNCTISSCTTGISVSAAWTSILMNYIDYNHFHNNTTDHTNVTAGANDILSAADVAPGFTDAAGGDFSRTTDALDDVGLGIRLGVS